MKKAFFLGLLIALVPLRVLSDTPPIIDIFKMKSETRTGVVTVAGGGVSNVVPGTSGNILTSNGIAWTSQAAAATPVISVFGRTGAVTAQSGDYSTSLVPEGSNLYWTQGRFDSAFGVKTTSNLSEGTNLYFTNARAQGAVSASPPLVDTAGVFSIPVATSSVNGYLSSADWSTFNGKQPSGNYITALTTDVVASGPGSVAATIQSNVVTNSKLAQMAANTLKGNNTGVTANASDLTVSQVNALLGDVTNITASSPLASSGGATPNLTCNVASGSQAGCLSSTDWTTFNGKQAAGSYITALTSDVSASGPGSASATVNSVGGSTAANVHSAELAANAATNLNTASTIVKRDSSGNFTAGTITAALTGHASSDEPAITAGTTAQYWRGDKSFQTLNTTAVPEGTNLYYTDTRVQTAAKNGTSALELYVSEDAGNDANDGSILHQYKSIGAAVTAANAIAAYYKQVDIHVSPINNGGSGNGGYHENVSLTQQGVNILCDDAGMFARACVVTGTLTVNLTGTSGGVNFIAASNEVKVKGMTFTSGSSDTVTFSGSTFQRLIAEGCYFQASAARAAILTNTGISGTSGSEFRSYDTTFENNSSTIETVKMTAGRFWMYGTTPTVMNDNASGPSFIQAVAATTTGNITSGSACIGSPGSLTGIAVGERITDSTNPTFITGGTTVLAIPGTCSAGQIQMSANAVGGPGTGDTLNFGGSSMIANLTQFTGQYQQSDNTSTASFNLATIASGTASCISTPTSINLNGATPIGYSLLSYFGCNSSNTNSITGSGIVILSPGNVRFGTSGDIVSTVTQAAIGPGLPQGEVMIGAGATTGTNVQLSMKDGHIKVAQTTVATATVNSSNTGTGSCSVSNAVDGRGRVTITTGSGTRATGTQCTVNFNKAFGVAPVCMLTPKSAGSAANTVQWQMGTETTAGFPITFNVAGAATTAYTFNYDCQETQ